MYCPNHQQGNSNMAYTQKLYSAFSCAIGAMENCTKNGNMEWHARWQDRIEYMCKHQLPHGSGINDGIRLDIERVSRNA